MYISPRSCFWVPNFLIFKSYYGADKVGFAAVVLLEHANLLWTGSDVMTRSNGGGAVIFFIRGGGLHVDTQ